jgi:hypothetical protein
MANIYTSSIYLFKEKVLHVVWRSKYFGQSFDCMDGKTNSIYFKTDNNVGFFPNAQMSLSTCTTSNLSFTVTCPGWGPRGDILTEGQFR